MAGFPGPSLAATLVVYAASSYGFQCYLFLCLWENYQTFLSLSFLVCKMGQ